MQKVYSRTIKPKKITMPNPKDIKNVLTETYKARKDARKSVAEQVAGDSFFKKNYYYPKGKELFPNDKDMHYVDKCFQYAIGGELMIDEPLTDLELKKCNEKAKAMKEMGLRYLILKPGMNVIDAIEVL